MANGPKSGGLFMKNVHYNFKPEASNFKLPFVNISNYPGVELKICAFKRRLKGNNLGVYGGIGSILGRLDDNI